MSSALSKAILQGKRRLDSTLHWKIPFSDLRCRLSFLGLPQDREAESAAGGGGGTVFLTTEGGGSIQGRGGWGSHMGPGGWRGGWRGLLFFLGPRRQKSFFHHQTPTPPPKIY